MPKMNGIEFYQRMKEIDKKVKVCFITASEIHYYQKITKELLPTLGARRLIRKPIKIEDLVKDLKQVLEFVNDKNNDNDHNNYN
jgi:CheY-like chemotaxis protein